MKNVLLIGFGKFGKILHEKLRVRGNVVAICKTRTDDYRLFLSRNDINLVVIATPIATHVALAKDCLNAGKDIFIEKPLSADPKEMREVFALAARRNKKIYVDDVFLWREEYQRLKKCMQKDRVTSIRFAFQKYGAFDDTILNAHVYHDCYLLADLFGEHEITNLEILSAKDPLEKGRIDKLSFRFTYGSIPVEGHYNRTSQERHKEITIRLKGGKTVAWRDTAIIENEMAYIVPPHDALGNMINAVLSDRVDYVKNNALTLQATTLLHEIEKIL